MVCFCCSPPDSWIDDGGEGGIIVDEEISSTAEPERIASHYIFAMCTDCACNASRPSRSHHPSVLHILSVLGSPDHLFGKQATLNLTLHESESERRRVDPNTCACACLPDGGMDGAAERLAFRDQVEVAQRFVPPRLPLRDERERGR